jgi:hypothetical protein
VKALVLSVVVVVAVAITAGAIWLERRHLACERRSAAFAQQVEDIRRGAAEELKIGAGRAEVTRFYEKRGIQFSVIKSEAAGTLYTPGSSDCSTFFCGSDEALIGIRVKLSPQGAVAEAPQVVNLYTNCL